MQKQPCLGYLWPTTCCIMPLCTVWFDNLRPKCFPRPCVTWPLWCSLAPCTFQHLTPDFLIAQAIEKELVWQRLRQLQAEGAFVPVIVESARPAGLICKVFDALTGFIPGSHVLEVGLLHSVASAVEECQFHVQRLSPT